MSLDKASIPIVETNDWDVNSQNAIPCQDLAKKAVE